MSNSITDPLAVASLMDPNTVVVAVTQGEFQELNGFPISDRLAPDGPDVPITIHASNGCLPIFARKDKYCDVVIGVVPSRHYIVGTIEGTTEDRRLIINTKRLELSLTSPANSRQCQFALGIVFGAQTVDIDVNGLLIVFTHQVALIMVVKFLGSSGISNAYNPDTSPDSVRFFSSNGNSELIKHGGFKQVAASGYNGDQTMVCAGGGRSGNFSQTAELEHFHSVMSSGRVTRPTIYHQPAPSYLQPPSSYPQHQPSHPQHQPSYPQHQQSHPQHQPSHPQPQSTHPQQQMIPAANGWYPSTPMPGFSEVDLKAKVLKYVGEAYDPSLNALSESYGRRIKQVEAKGIETEKKVDLLHKQSEALTAVVSELSKTSSQISGAMAAFAAATTDNAKKHDELAVKVESVAKQGGEHAIAIGELSKNNSQVSGAIAAFAAATTENAKKHNELAVNVESVAKQGGEHAIAIGELSKTNSQLSGTMAALAAATADNSQTMAVMAADNAKKNVIMEQHGLRLDLHDCDVNGIKLELQHVDRLKLELQRRKDEDEERRQMGISLSGQRHSRDGGYRSYGTPLITSPGESRRSHSPSRRSRNVRSRSRSPDSRPRSDSRHVATAPSFSHFNDVSQSHGRREPSSAKSMSSQYSGATWSCPPSRDSSYSRQITEDGRQRTEVYRRETNRDGKNGR